MYEYELTEDEHCALLIALGMALSACRHDEQLIKMVRKLIFIFAPDSNYGLPKEKP